MSDAEKFATQAYEQAEMLSYAILAVIQQPESLPATLACMMMSKFCKMKFISSIPGLGSNDADLMIRDLEDIIEHNAGPMMERLMKRRDKE